MRNAVDFKYYDITAEDHSAHRDPRPIENLEDVINPGFDENGTILTDPLPPHIPRLSQSDRQIFESCAVAGSKILWPHQNNSGIQKHLTVQYIMNKAKCTVQEANYIADSCVALEATAKMVDTFCEWGKKKGAKKLIEYLWKFVIGITEAEAPSDEHEPWENEPVTAGAPLWGNALDRIRGHNGICEDVEIDEIKVKVKEPGLAKIKGDKIIWPKSKLDFLPTSLPAEEELTLTSEDLTVIEEPESETAPSAIAYHVLKDFNAEEEIPWIDRQPKRFIDKLKKIQACKTLAELTELGQTIHGNNNLNRDQAGVFWTEYNSRKHMLEPKHLGLTARSFLKKIIQSNGHIGALGVFLHNVQSNKIKVTPELSKHEWGVIWKTYKRRKEVHANA